MDQAMPEYLKLGLTSPGSYQIERSLPEDPDGYELAVWTEA